MISQRRTKVSEVKGDGLTMTVFPMAKAGAIFQQASNKGKFHGTIKAHTPIGSC